MLSKSHSRLQSSIQKIDSHIKSTLPHLQGKEDKKYVHIKIHQFLEDNRVEGLAELKSLLTEQFDDKV